MHASPLTATPAAASALDSVNQGVLDASDTFPRRHIGSSAEEGGEMLAALGYGSLDELIEDTLPPGIGQDRPLDLGRGGRGLGERAALDALAALADKNTVHRSMIGMGYHGTITPPVIQRMILENPLWYTPYTPYQAEIAQGRLESLLNFQTMVADLTGLELANASLLDEATAAAEAMAMCHAVARGKKPAFYAAGDCHPQTLAVVKTRAQSMGIDLRIGAPLDADFDAHDYSGVLLQYPATDGRIEDYRAIVDKAHEHKALAVVAADPLALTLLTPPGEWGADIVVGSTQRFGVPMGMGGPHAAYMATHEKYARKMPGRLIGVSKDAQGNPAYRMALQTREQHIRRDKATSNICTAQVLLANVAAMYGVYHGPEGLKTIARRVHAYADAIAQGLAKLGCEVSSARFFDTVTVTVKDADATLATAAEVGINLRRLGDTAVAITTDETTTRADVRNVFAAFAGGGGELPDADQLAAHRASDIEDRTSAFMTHPVFHLHRSEHEMLRYITHLQRKDISLADSMIPLGSCTMKLNAAAEMLPITWASFARIHPFAPREQAAGYHQLFDQLEAWLAEITGFSAVSLQPNAGSQGEYAGLLTIRAYHKSRGEEHRDVCLIPVSAHGTNPASAVIAGFKVVPVQCKDNGDIDPADLKARCAQHGERLAAVMITYPSTHGVFEPTITEVCQVVHDHGGQVYLDGANLQAQVGLARPGDYGADVCHLNLHKTFCIPHGGGGPGMGPIGAADHLAPFLPGHPLDPDCGGAQAIGPVAAAPYGSPSILPISWMYIAMMGGDGLTDASKHAVLNANYMAKRLSEHYDILYTGAHGTVAHEFILDCRGFEKSAGVTVDDITKRLMDFGFHGPTMSWPVPGTLMVEPTESESKEELDRFCDALVAIRAEVAAIENGEMTRDASPLAHAPHTAEAVTADAWDHAYGREQAAYPLPWLRQRKYWPAVGRIDNPFGDRNLMCACPPMETYADNA